MYKLIKSLLVAGSLFLSSSLSPGSAYKDAIRGATRGCLELSYSNSTTLVSHEGEEGSSQGHLAWEPAYESLVYEFVPSFDDAKACDTLTLSLILRRSVSENPHVVSVQCVGRGGKSLIKKVCYDLSQEDVPCLDAVKVKLSSTTVENQETVSYASICPAI